MVAAEDNSLTLGLRTLATLAKRGPLDVSCLASLHDSHAPYITDVIAELERDGLVRRLPDRSLFDVTRRGAALIGCEWMAVH